LQGSSPDEVALVKFSNLVKMELKERDRTYVVLKNAAGEAKPDASRWRTVSVPSVKAIIYGQTVYWKK
jgi:hypothetical protein